jgi:murein DD-endopeptidase MepM/ murein hydrolase activator NlpD
MSKTPVPPEPPSLAAANSGARRPDFSPIFPSPSLLAITQANASRSANEPRLVTVSHEIARGETLDQLLEKVGLAAPDRNEIALALSTEYDLRRLRPGDHIITSITPDGAPRHVMLVLEDGMQVEVVFNGRDPLITRVTEPEPEQFTVAGEARIESSIFAALDEAGLPVRFAVDLAQMLGGTVDFRRDLSGGETLSLLWRETRVGNELVRQPEITFAALDLGDALYEVVWPEDGSGRAVIYRDGEVMRIFAQPVEGARLSSVFGRRRHPVYGNVRMHTGVDFAAAHGTPVQATAPGRVSFIGRRKGFGRVVEISHGEDTMSRYAHLSATQKGLAVGGRVTAGDIIGNVGATGTATGPNLHYEVRVNGQPTDPLMDDRLAAAETELLSSAALGRLKDSRERLATHLERRANDTIDNNKI